jgi:hypothetical protein
MFAGGGEIRDPNNMGNAVSSNLDFSQHNHVAMAVAAALGQALLMVVMALC